MINARKCAWNNVWWWSEYAIKNENECNSINWCFTMAKINNCFAAFEFNSHLNQRTIKNCTSKQIDRIEEKSRYRQMNFQSTIADHMIKGMNQQMITFILTIGSLKLMCTILCGFLCVWEIKSINETRNIMWKLQVNYTWR